MTVVRVQHAAKLAVTTELHEHTLADRQPNQIKRLVHARSQLRHRTTVGLVELRRCVDGVEAL